MQEHELIPVYIRIESGKTVCLCPLKKKRCKRECERDVVSRDRFDGWMQTMKRNKYGR